MSNVRPLMPHASFRFGGSDQHKVLIDCGLLGHERYSVDGKIVLQQWNLRLHGVREFAYEDHKIRVTIEISRGQARGMAYVNGQLKKQDLFREFNAKYDLSKYRSRLRVRLAIWSIVGLVLLAFLWLKNAAA